MNVVYITQVRIPSRNASGIQVMKMCQALEECGCSTTLMIPKSSRKQPDAGTLWRFYGIRKPFRIQFFPNNRLFLLQAVIKSIECHADLIYTRCIYAASLAALLGKQVILEFHDLIRLRRHVALCRRLSNSTRIHKFVFITHSLRRDMLSSYPGIFPEGTTCVEPDGVDLEVFERISNADGKAFLDRIGLTRRYQLVAGYAVNLYKGKGIEVIKALAPRMPHVGFLVAGGQPEDLKKELTEIRSRNIINIHMIGFLNPADVPVFCKACDVLLLPNQKEVEAYGGGNIGKYTSPLKLFEYMASGSLIIASDLPVLREILNERNAMLVSPDDVTAWKDTLEWVVTKPAEAMRLSFQARADVTRYDWKERVRRILGTAKRPIPRRVDKRNDKKE